MVGSGCKGIQTRVGSIRVGEGKRKGIREKGEGEREHQEQVDTKVSRIACEEAWEWKGRGGKR